MTRVRTFPILERVMVGIFGPGLQNPHEFIQDAIPPDAKIMGVEWDAAERRVLIQIQSDQFTSDAPDEMWPVVRTWIFQPGEKLSDGAAETAQVAVA